MVRMSEGFRSATGASHALKRLFLLPRQSPIDPHKTYDERLLGQDTNRFIQQCFRLFPLADHHCGLGCKIDCVLVTRALGSPGPDLFHRRIELAVPEIDLDNTVIGNFLRLEWAASFVHFTSTIEQAD